MIKVIKETNKKVIGEPNYLLTFNYMIGDANGKTYTEVSLSIDNPFIERFCTLLNGLKPTCGRWGVMLDKDHLNESLEENNITEDEYKFLDRTLFENWDENEETKYFTDINDINFANEFYDGVRSQTEYSFLVFEGVTLEYVDEYGNVFPTKFVD